jgi:hypothetical protein
MAMAADLLPSLRKSPSLQVAMFQELFSRVFACSIGFLVLGVDSRPRRKSLAYVRPLHRRSLRTTDTHTLSLNSWVNFHSNAEDPTQCTDLRILFYFLSFGVFSQVQFQKHAKVNTKNLHSIVQEIILLHNFAVQEIFFSSRIFLQQ